MRYIMIGAPVTKVRTPEVLERLMAEVGVEATVETSHVEPDALDGFMSEAVRDRTIDGLMITMPHKKASIAHLARISTTAKAAGSVNSAKRLASGEMVGAQFDGLGLVAALGARGADLKTARVLLAGVGGAGLPIAQAILAHGCASLAILDTNRALRDAAIASLRGEADVPVSATEAPLPGAYDLLINATPLGMRDDDPSPFADKLVASTDWVADIVADPSKTRTRGDGERGRGGARHRPRNGQQPGPADPRLASDAGDRAIGLPAASRT